MFLVCCRRCPARTIGRTNDASGALLRELARAAAAGGMPLRCARRGPAPATGAPWFDAECCALRDHKARFKHDFLGTCNCASCNGATTACAAANVASPPSHRRASSLTSCVATRASSSSG